MIGRCLLLVVCLLAALAGSPDARAAVANSEGKVVDPVPLLEFRTAGQAGWFWTLSQAEGNAAEGQYGMARQHTRLGFLRRQAFPGSQPLYRLRVADRSAYLLTASASERQSLLDSGRFTEGGVLGHLAAGKQAGTELLYRMSNGAEWRVVPAAKQAEFAGRGYRTDGPLGYVWPAFHRTGAVYFGTFDAKGNQAMMAGTQRVYGRAGDWWGGLRDFAGAGVPRNAWHWPREDFTDREPAIGFYDDAQPETLRKQIIQATGAGLRYFSFYWYWNPADGGAENYIEGLRAFLKASNRTDIDFNVLPCLHPWKDGPVSLALPAEQITKAANLIVDTYLTQPNYLRANDGRPILSVCDARGIGRGTADGMHVEDTRRFTDAVRARAREKLGEEVLITVNGGVPAGTGFEGSDCLGQFDSSRSYQRYADNQRAFFRNFPGTLLRCATSDFDERPRIAISIPDPGPDPELLRQRFRWYPDADLPGFERLLAAVRQDIAESTRPSTVDNFVSLYAWNEWHEGGYVEPNKRDGCAYLDAVRRQLGLTTGAGCVAAPA
ncbi:glycoside hydrolase family 99-like domain-containing protein [Crossiella sp. CA-258035]|uniref:glycoside hydrolase family 99-like domain-containing protein n=1 Tax=Crossiella sp. CA-258035 TaxID=2981138 RepID=UPI0024BC21DA|nr:glycoside hydrolase family 99-like domain-containing protein [Crossiella sp. CA-258035]WHT23164.1 glycoside hydrolase family 99-like domain-containing protein [Crossiella sp. CA-258035]